jgi:hypothetical protein
VLLNSDVIMTIEKVTGQHSRGWLGPAALTETFNTPALLAELGLSYVLAWTNDDQPYPLTVPGMVSVPYSVELTDIPFADSADGGRVMAPGAASVRHRSGVPNHPPRRVADHLLRHRRVCHALTHPTGPLHAGALCDLSMFARKWSSPPLKPGVVIDRTFLPSPATG